MNQQLRLTLLVAAMSLATAWAIRGQFGHEQGAAWAGGIGGLAIVLLARRPDWYAKAFHISLASAAGWGIGGIISYGIVVGYGHATSFVNAYYGLGMLFVIGALFGLIGGGMFGLMLSDRVENKVSWPQVIVEMTAGAILFYYLFVEQLGWLMTPPRSEAWAACFGMMVALFWYMARKGHIAAIRVAVFAGLGGGFGFAFGNFIQVISRESGIHFNFWNVMEYSIGFFGGLGMAYGTFTAEWPKTAETIDRNKMLAPLLILALIIPFVVWDQSFGTERVSKMVAELAPLADNLSLTRKIQGGAIALVFISSAYWIYYFFGKNKNIEITLHRQDLKKFFLSQLGLYTLFSILITGAFLSLYRIEQYLYIVNMVAIGFLLDRFHPTFSKRGLHWSRWAVNLIFILIVIALLAAVAIHTHGEMPNAHNRFE